MRAAGVPCEVGSTLATAVALFHIWGWALATMKILTYPLNIWVIIDIWVRVLWLDLGPRQNSDSPEVHSLTMDTLIHHGYTHSPWVRSFTMDKSRCLWLPTITDILVYYPIECVVSSGHLWRGEYVGNSSACRLWKPPIGCSSNPTIECLSEPGRWFQCRGWYLELICYD